MERLDMALVVANTTYLPKSTVTRKLSRERAANKVLLSLVICLSIFSAICVFLLIGSAAKIAGMDTQITGLKLELEGARAELLMMKDKYVVLNEGFDELSDKTETLAKSLTSMMKVNKKLESQNQELAEQDEVFRAAIAEYESRVELYDQYSYAILRSNGSRTDITYDQIRTVEELAEEEGVDADLVLSMVMVESGGNENATNAISTARGYGQLLAGTGKFVYEKLLERGSYHHSKALDGDVNLEMMVSYLSYLDENTSSLYGTIMRYRGEDGEVLRDYISKIDYYLKKKDKSVLQLSQS